MIASDSYIIVYIQLDNIYSQFNHVTHLTLAL